MMNHLKQIKEMRETLHMLCLAVVPELSAKVLQAGKVNEDGRTLLRFSSSEIGKVWERYEELLTNEAACQMLRINNAGYCFPENISMMLEQGDYFKQDLPHLIEIAEQYISGTFKQKNEETL